METRAAKRRAKAATILQNLNLKRQRVVLGELPTSPNFSSTLNQNKERLQFQKNPNVNKPAITNKTLSSPDANFDHTHIDEPYVSDIYSYLRAMEMQSKRRPMIDYIENVQKEVTTNMRGILVDWLVEVAEEYKLLSYTLHLSVSYIDRFLSVIPVTRSRLQLLGVSSMFIAAKYEEIKPPDVEEFCSITDNTYDKAEVVKMEADILKYLRFEMGNPTVNTFLGRLVAVVSENQNTPNSNTEFLCSYLAELSLLDYDCLRFLPSVIAASVMFLAGFIIRPEVHPWASYLCECSGYSSGELKECVLILHDLYLSRRSASLKAVREKYKKNKFKCVANLPSPPHIPGSYFKDQ